MKLYTQKLAPNPTKLELYLAEKAALGVVIPLERISVNLMRGEQRGAEITGKNQLQRVPFLEFEDGAIIPESLAIIEYFEETWPQPTLIGASTREKAQVRALERWIDFDILYSVAIMVHATRSPTGLPASPAVVDWFADLVKRRVATLEALMADGREFVAGAKLTIADCTLAAALQFARFGKMDLLPAAAHISAWDARYRQRPAAQAVLIV